MSSRQSLDGTHLEQRAAKQTTCKTHLHPFTTALCFVTPRKGIPVALQKLVATAVQKGGKLRQSHFCEAAHPLRA